MKQNQTDQSGYLTEEQLQQLMQDVEQNCMLQAPEYMANIIQNQAKRQAVKDSVEIIPIRNTIRESIQEGRPAFTRTKNQKVQLFTYSMKIVAAAAAAIALVLVIPMLENAQIQKTSTERYGYQQEVGEENHWDSKVQKKSMMQNLNDTSSNLCNQLFEGTSKIFHREEK